MRFPIIRGGFRSQLSPEALKESVTRHVFDSAHNQQPFEIKTMSTRPIDLNRIFDLENIIAERRLQLLSASADEKDADYSERLKLLRDAIKLGKRPRRADGKPMSDQELLSMPFDKMRELLANTPGDGVDEQPKTLSATGTIRNVRPLAEILDEENERRYGKGR